MNILPQKISGIYKIENTVNGKRYIGSSVNIAKRRRQHLNLLHKNKHHSIYLQRAFNKWGECAFEFSVLEIVPDVQLLLSVEQHYLDTLKHEYNTYPTAGSTLGVKRNAKTRAQMSASAMGHIVSPETGSKISAAKYKPVLQYKKNMEFVTEFPSLKAAMAATGVYACSISVCCGGKRKSAGGFVWKYKTA